MTVRLVFRAAGGGDCFGEVASFAHHWVVMSATATLAVPPEPGAFSLATPPLFAALAPARSVLVAGAGGGFDVYAGLPLAIALWQTGVQVHLANLSFSQLELLDRDQWAADNVAAVTPDATSADEYFPERALARWLAARELPSTVYAFPKVGVQPLRAAYRHLVERLGIEAVVLVDGGTSVHGYASDITRTVVFGQPSPEAQKVFDIVHEAQRRALAFAAPGKKCGEVDGVARQVVTDAGYGPDYRTFTHRLGHGIGMEGHEWPYLVRGSQVVLQPGMTFSDEPGIYQYGKFGIRLEDIMAITDRGAEMMTATQTSLSPNL